MSLRVILLAIVWSAATNPIRAADDPVAYWSFDEGTGDVASDDSGNGSDGRLRNGPTWVFGVHGMALSFDGLNDFVDMGSPTTLDDLGPMTVSLWMNLNSTGCYLISKRDSCGGYWRIATESTNGPNGIAWLRHASGQGLVVGTVAGTFQHGEWTHVAITWDGGLSAAGVKILVDGVEARYAWQTNGIGSIPSDAACRLRVGSRAGSSEFVDGAIDEVRIYDRVLSPEEIDSLADPNGSVGSPEFRRGDGNADGQINLTDGVFVLNYLFLSGPVPPCLEASDSNNDDQVNITDGIYVLNHLFLGGPPPPAPFAVCRRDPTATVLACDSFPPCE